MNLNGDRRLKHWLKVHAAPDLNQNIRPATPRQLYAGCVATPQRTERRYGHFRA